MLQRGQHQRLVLTQMGNQLQAGGQVFKDCFIQCRSYFIPFTVDDKYSTPVFLMTEPKHHLYCNHRVNSNDNKFFQRWEPSNLQPSSCFSLSFPGWSSPRCAYRSHDDIIIVKQSLYLIYLDPSYLSWMWNIEIIIIMITIQGGTGCCPGSTRSPTGRIASLSQVPSLPSSSEASPFSPN